MNFIKIAVGFNLKSHSFRNLSTTPKYAYKICVIGASGEIGQSLSMLLKLNPLITEIALFDIHKTLGVGIDLQHLSKKCKITSYKGGENVLKTAMSCSDIVVISGGKPYKPNMAQSRLFKENAKFIRDLASIFSIVVPNAMWAMITNPVNSLLPIVGGVLEAENKFNPNKVFAVTNATGLRASTFIGDILNKDPAQFQVDVVGGHSIKSMVPVLSQTRPEFKDYKQHQECLTEKIRMGAKNVAAAKGGDGAETLSMAYAGSVFIDALLRGLNGEKNIVQCAMVRSDIAEPKYFVTPLLLGKEGVEKNLGLPPLDDFEQKLLNSAIPLILEDIKKAEEFLKKV